MSTLDWSTSLQKNTISFLTISINKYKTYVKSLREKLEETDKFMHDQYPADVVAHRKELVPILKRAKADGKQAYIKYNKLLVAGEVYSDGACGKVPA